MPPAEDEPVTAHELLSLVRKRYTGAQGRFIMARLKLQSRLDLDDLSATDRDPDKAKRLRSAMEIVCPDLLSEIETSRGAQQ